MCAPCRQRNTDQIRELFAQRGKPLPEGVKDFIKHLEPIADEDDSDLEDCGVDLDLRRTCVDPFDA